jgi:hypothetical protein
MSRRYGELIYLTLHDFWNIPDFGASVRGNDSINTTTLENRELKKPSLI